VKAIYEKIKPYLGGAAFILTFLFGSGLLYKQKDIINKEEKLLIDENVHIIDQHKKLNDIKNRISDISAEYLVESDKTYNNILQSTSEQRVQLENLKNKLVYQINTFNQIEFSLSMAEDRNPEFFKIRDLFTDNYIDVESNKSEMVLNFYGRVLTLKNQAGLNHQEVISSVNSTLDSLLNQKDEAFRLEYLMNECRSGDARRCTDYAIESRSRASSENSWAFSSDGVELLRKACKRGDAFGCERLSFHYFSLKNYEFAAMWSKRACDLFVARACTFVGGLYASEKLGENKDYSLASYYLSKGCLLKSGESCYALAVLEISGWLGNNKAKAIPYLDRGCHFGNEISCISKQRFNEFSNCDSESIEKTIEDAIGDLSEENEKMIFEISCIKT